MLAVEVLSRSAAIHDLTTKKAVYQRLDVPSYWVIDAAGRISPRSNSTVTGCCQQVAKAAGAEPFDAVRPFPVRLGAGRAARTDGDRSGGVVIG
ncbi:Uma2 family endonuclease [Amycolatopsis sulphurea]|uniref:Uma2 family endonuclease n=1 Tax=Amycolatopsis sulphurea TaxID=76022 RepID=UPI001FEA4A39|nr:Uma2 family endonuclease [Amycolatopsis sulphurea]